MLYVSLFVELLRSRPALAVMSAALIQATLWASIPALFYGAPPGDVPLVLAIGHEFPLGSYLGPPLAFWLAEAAFDIAGRHAIGVYLLSQVCVVATYWTVFLLGRSIVGAHHAALAVLLLVGVSALTVSTPEFGPVVLAMPLWAAVLLHYWRAVAEGRRGYWLALAVEVGLLVLTTYVGLLLAALLVLFTFLNKRTRPVLATTDPWLAGIVALIVMFPHFLWLSQSRSGLLFTVAQLRTPESVVGNFGAWVKLIALVIGAHSGLVVLVGLVAGWPWAKKEPAPVIARQPLDPLGSQFVYFFAIVPVLTATSAAVLIEAPGPVGGVAPLIILSGLAVIVAAGDEIEFTHQHVVIWAWFGLLFVPPAMAVGALVAAPLLGIEIAVNEPANAMGQFFGETFERRVGTPLPIIAGNVRVATLVAMEAHGRPSLYFDAAPERSPWVTVEALKTKGAIVVWPTSDTAGIPPAEIKERFPDIVSEVPRAFERPVQGQLPLFRIGWALIRPQGANR